MFVFRRGPSPSPPPALSSHPPPQQCRFPLFSIDSCMNIQVQNIQNFLWRLRRKMLKIFSGAFGAKISKFSLAPSAQNIQIFFRRLRRKIFKFFSALRAKRKCNFLLETKPESKYFSALRAKRKCHFFKGSGFRSFGNNCFRFNLGLI